MIWRSVLAARVVSEAEAAKVASQLRKFSKGECTVVIKASAFAKNENTFAFMELRFVTALATVFTACQRIE